MLNEIIKIAKDAGKIALAAEEDRHIMSKEGRGNFVTEYDKRVQSFIIEKLSALMPEAYFLGEEGDTIPNEVGDGYVFIIDPIDGTMNFIKGNPSYAISIALVKDTVPIMGVVYSPLQNTLYYAEKGKGAKVVRNGVEKILHTSDCGLDGAIIGFGTCPYSVEMLYKSFDTVKKLLSRASDVRRSGSAALDICFVAEGVLDLMLEMKLFVWDFCAASLILSEAGGIYSQFDGSKAGKLVNSSYICGSPNSYAEAIDFLKELANK